MITNRFMRGRKLPHSNVFNIIFPALLLSMTLYTAPAVGAVESKVLLQETFDGNTGVGLAKKLLASNMTELARGQGVGGSDAIRMSYKGNSGGSSRLIFPYPLKEKVAKATLFFDVLFEQDWQWVRGGKLHGLQPDNKVSGGGQRSPYRWSARAVFSPNGHISNYFYDQNDTYKYGTVTTSASPVFKKNRWHRVALQISLNTDHKANGSQRILIDGRQVVSANGIRYRGEFSDRTLISKLHVSTFYGGHTSEWAPRNADGSYATTHARFDNFLVVAGIHDSPPDTQNPPSVNHPPVAKISTQLVGQTLSANGQGSSDPDGDTLHYTWSFGDGATATGKSVNHVYAAGGRYTVKLNVSDGHLSSNASSSVSVSNPPKPPVDPRTTALIHVSGDTYVRGGSYANRNYGTESDMVVKTALNLDAYTRIAYLQFAVDKLPVDFDKVLLELVPSDIGTGAATASWEVALVTTKSNWSETKLNYNNRPTATGKKVSFSGLAKGKSKSVDVSELIRSHLQAAPGMACTLRIRGLQANSHVEFAAREKSGDTDPHLRVLGGEIQNPTHKDLRISVAAQQKMFASDDIDSYSKSQDRGSARIVADGHGLQLTGNVWKSIPLNYPITKNTCIAFDLEVSNAGELVGIGFDNDNDHSNNLFGTANMFVLAGSQATPTNIHDLRNLHASSVVIPVGRYYTGTANRLCFMGDDDAHASTDAAFSNIRIYEQGTNPPPDLVSDLSISSGKKYTWFSAKINQKTYIDRDYKITGLPSILQNALALRTANDDKQSNAAQKLISFTVNQDAAVYIAYDNGNTTLENKWCNSNNGWETQSLAIQTSLVGDNGRIMRRKFFKAGSTVTLNGNGGTSNTCSMYYVMVIPSNATHAGAPAVNN